VIRIMLFYTCLGLGYKENNPKTYYNLINFRITGAFRQGVCKQLSFNYLKIKRIEAPIKFININTKLESLGSDNKFNNYFY